jgi:predicted GNAT family N-acyltransferase
MSVVVHMGTDVHLEDCLEIRRHVFVNEQGVDAQLEFDGLDHTCFHCLLSEWGKPVATARVRFLGSVAKIERMAVLKESRRKGYGGMILSRIIDLLNGMPEVVSVKLHAQKYAAPFYARHGFRVHGEPFVEADIEHVLMHRRIP